MSEARERILADIRNSLGRGRLDSETEAELRARVAAHRRNPIPARATALDEQGRLELFVAMAEEVQATVTSVNLAGRCRRRSRAISPRKTFRPSWSWLPTRASPRYRGIPGPCCRSAAAGRSRKIEVSVTPCHAAIAETGTLMLISGAQTPTTLNFLPETHIVVVRGDQVVATYEDGWDRLPSRRNERGAAADRQFRHRSVAHGRYRAAHRTGCAWATASPYCSRRGGSGGGK